MLRNSLILLSCITIINCKKIENETQEELNNDINNYYSSEEEIEFTSIFIGLSPKMSDKTFSEAITKLNNENKLIDNKFPVIVENENYLFSIQKTRNSIKLNYSKQETKSSENINYEISDKYLRKYNSEKDKFIKVFDSKYSLSEVQLPKNILLQNYDLNKEYYRLYKDLEKSILLGFSVIGDKYPSKEEIMIAEQEKRKKTPDHPLENVGDFIINEQNDNYVIFGIEIEINYYHNDEMENLLFRMKNESDKIKENEDETLKNDLHKVKIAKKNLNEL